MIRNKKIKVFVSIVIAILIILGISQNIVLAETDVNMTIKLSKERYIKDGSGVYQSKNSYVLNTGKDHPVYQLAAYSGNEIIATNLYCLNATAGYTWTNGTTGQSVSYNKAYDLVEEKDAIKNLDSIYSDILNEDIYTQVMWILDNMYTEGVTTEEVLNNAGIVYGTNPVYPSIEDWHYNSRTEVWPYGYSGYHYTYNDTRYSVVLSEEEVEVVQQAAIWYFTNYIAKGDEEYNCYTDEIGPEKTNGIWFSYTESTTSDDELNSDIKGMKQEQAAILYNYLVDGAKKAAEEGYDSSEEATLSLKYVSEDKKIEEDGTNYVIGPMILTTTGEVTNIQVEALTGEDYKTTISSSDITLKNSDGSTITSITPGEEFTIEIPQDSVDTSVKVTVTGKSTETTKLLVISNNTNAEQPIVEIEKKPVDLEDELIATPEVPKLFDLALRKQIIAVNGQSTIVNENGLDATRKMNIDTSSIPDTATYKHRKDPVVVSTGDIVTYKISIYNEGEVDGYASKIVDQLASNMVNDPSMATTVTSAKGNTYKVTYNSSSNQIILEIDKTKTITNLKAYDGKTLDTDSIEITCKINQKAETDGTTKHYLTNIAYINEEYDEDGNKIEQDRVSESKPGTHPTETSSELNETNRNNVYHGSTNGSIFNTGTNNDFYFAGQEDDDDFETVVVLPKKFDLALRKYIASISKNSDFTNSETTTYNRVPQVNTSELKNGTATTAKYNHSKEPIVVDIEDYVLYTIRVYNEGEVDGYAAEIVDYLPEYLDFMDSSNTYINSINSKWTYDPQTRKITTTSLAGTKLAAFDAENDDGAGSGLSYADVQVVCKINSKATEAQKITNIAEISKYADENGERDEDIDSYPDDLEYPDDESTYKDEEIAGGNPYIPGQEDDDDFEKVIVRGPGQYDLILIKQDESGEQLNSTATFEVNGQEKQITGRLVVADDVEINKSNVNTPDVYIIKETKAPDGYCEFEGIITVTVTKELTDDNKYVVKSVTYTVTNEDGEEIDIEGADVYLNDDGNIYVEVVNLEEPEFDLALRKYIVSVSHDGEFSDSNTTTTYDREPDVDTSKLKEGSETTAEYNHSKEPIIVDIGDYILYTIRVYNEGEAAGYASEIVDYLPEYLDFVTSTEEYINSINSKWTYDAATRKLTTTALADTLIPAFDVENDNGAGSGLSYADVQVICKVNENATSKLTNIAEISDAIDENGNKEDIDSTPDDLEYPEDVPTYKDDEIEEGKPYIPGQEDDDDFEKVIVRRPGQYDLILIKQDENGTQLNSTATFEVNGEEKQVTGYLVIADDVEINKSNVDTADVYTIKEKVAPDGYCEFGGTITITVTKELTEEDEYIVKSVDYTVTNEDGTEFNTEDADVYLSEDGNIYVEVKNYEEINLKIIKVAEEDKSITLSGTEFALYEFVGETSDDELIDVDNVSSDWKLVDTYITSDTGEIELENLSRTSEYRLVETKASEGRLIADGQWKIEFVSEDYDENDESIVAIGDTKIKITAIGNPPALTITDEGAIQIPNRQYYSLPTSGGSGIRAFYTVGIVIIIIGLAILFLRKRVYIVRKK